MYVIARLLRFVAVTLLLVVLLSFMLRLLFAEVMDNPEQSTTMIGFGVWGAAIALAALDASRTSRRAG